MSERIRVLQFVSAFDVGGTERHVANLLKSYDDGRFRFQVAAFRAEGGLLADFAEHADWGTEYPIRRLYGFGTWRQQLRLSRALRRRRVQVLHAYGFYANCFAIPAAKIAGVPVIIGSIRDVGASWTPMQQRVERTVFRLADSVLTNADAVKQKLVGEGYPADKIAVIRNGVDVQRFASADPAEDFRSEIGVPEGVPLVGVVARIDAVKGLDDFVEAAARVARTRPDAHFVLVGDSFPTEEHRAYHSALVERVRSLGIEERLVFAGNRSDVPSILPQLAVSVLPSLTEGLPNALLEAMAAGVPVVATAVGGTPEVIEGGVNGLLVPRRDPQRLADAIGRLLDDRALAGRMASAGNETVDARFSLRAMARLTEDHYLAALRRAGGRAAAAAQQASVGTGPGAARYGDNGRVM